MSVTAILKPTLESFATHINTTPPPYEPIQPNTAAEESTSADNSRFSFLNKLRQDRFSNIRPLNEFFDKNRFNYTTSFQIISQRWNYNLQYFSSNYCLIMLGLAVYSILTDWWLLFTISFIFGGLYMISKVGNDGPINIAGLTTISASALYVAYACGSLVLLLFSGATGAIFWIIGASALLILGHAAVLEPGVEEGFADNQV